MKGTPVLLLTVLASLAMGVAPADEPAKVGTPGKPQDAVFMTASNPLMYRAIRKARAELAGFLELAEAPRKSQQDIKVRVTLLEGNAGEYIWLTRFKQDDNGLFTGYIDGDIHMKSRYRKGDRFTFVRGDIIDWTWTDSIKGVIYGAYTDCALATLAPADEAAKFRKAHKLNCVF